MVMVVVVRGLAVVILMTGGWQVVMMVVVVLLVIVMVVVVNGFVGRQTWLLYFTSWCSCLKELKNKIFKETVD